MEHIHSSKEYVIGTDDWHNEMRQAIKLLILARTSNAKESNRPKEQNTAMESSGGDRIEKWGGGEKQTMGRDIQDAT